jgi:hypothetical protein
VQKIVLEIVERLTEIYNNREEARIKAQQAANFMRTHHGSDVTTGKFIQLLDKNEFGIEKDAASILMIDPSIFGMHSSMFETALKAVLGDHQLTENDILLLTGSGTVVVLCLIYAVSIASSRSKARKECKEWLTAYYKEKAPAKLSDVDRIVAAFSDLQQLQKVVKAKYEGKKSD